MLYLLGEYDADQAADFERQLQSSHELADELLRQAELIAGLSQSPVISQSPMIPPSVEVVDSRLPLLASVLAIAACIALFVLAVQPGSPDSDRVASLSNSAQSIPSEEILIARAWADSRFDEMLDDGGLADLYVDDALALATDDAEDVDATLSWMFIGVSANIDAHSEDATNDG